MYESFQIMIDDPASKLSLGFDDYAEALAEIARVSRPQFAIGVFGAWGSGKTTLMRGMETTLRADPTVLPVWFNAWRYEKEEHLVVPLLDTIRDEVEKWGAERAPSAESQKRARRLATALGRAARAVFSGLTVKAGVPGALDVSLDANKVATAWRSSAGDGPVEPPQSFYHAAFLALKAAVTDFMAREGGAASQRFVIFIDDLDRCLPEKALEVLESMKLFFDLEGFVFVVGLDQRVIERAVQLKYPAGPQEAVGAPATYIGGAEYVKKIFQVQFTAPRIDQSDLVKFLDAIAEGEGLPDEQRADLALHVAPQISNLAASTAVNPREVKRLVNAYTMQMKMLERKLRDLGQSPSAGAVISLQIMSFRADWHGAYEALSSNPTEFIDGLQAALANNESAIAVDQEVLELPASFLGYARTAGQALLDLGSELDLYVSSLEAARSTDPAAREIAQVVGRIRVAHRIGGPEAPARLRQLLDEFQSRLSGTSFYEVIPVRPPVRDLIASYPTPPPPDVPEDAEQVDLRNQAWLDQVGAVLPLLTEFVADVRLRTATAASSAA
jgi:hypothetical protein